MEVVRRSGTVGILADGRVFATYSLRLEISAQEVTSIRAGGGGGELSLIDVLPPPPLGFSRRIQSWVVVEDFLFDGVIVDEEELTVLPPPASE